MSDEVKDSTLTTGLAVGTNGSAQSKPLAFDAEWLRQVREKNPAWGGNLQREKEA